MIQLLDYISREGLLPLKSQDHDGLIQELICSCLKDLPPDFQNRVVEDIKGKSRSQNPQDLNLGKGFALVHSRQDDCDRIRVVLGFLPEEKKIYKGDKVHTLIGIVLPSAQSRLYLSLLARLGRLMGTEGASEVFNEAGSLMAQGQMEAGAEKVLGYVRAFEEA